MAGEGPDWTDPGPPSQVSVPHHIRTEKIRWHACVQLLEEAVRSLERRLRNEVTNRRRPRRLEIAWDCLEERKVLSHVGGFHHQHFHAALTSSAHTSGTSTGTTGSSSATTTGSSSSNTALETARQTLKTDIQAIESNSGTTIGELTAIHTAFQTLKSDGLTPSSQSALASFEDSLVTSFASGTSLTGNATLLSQFEALYTSSPTTQQTTDLTTAYNALAAAVTSSNITQANVTTIANDWTAVLAAESSTSTAAFPYFTLVTGQTPGPGGGHGGGCGG